MAFGPHLTLDVYNCDDEQLANLTSMYNLLADLPDLIGMTPITQPQVFRYQGKVKEDWGVTGFLVIAESHLSFHSFPEKKCIFIDLFSCRDFDIETTIEFVKSHLSVTDKDIRQTLLMRGEKFPRSKD